MADNNLQINPALIDFYQSKARNYVLIGGRGSSKTQSTAAFLIYLSSQFKIRTLCTRQFQSRISDSVKSVIEECITLAGMEKDFHITENAIRHKKTGSDFSFMGIQRNLNDIKGTSGVDVLWIEEADFLTSDQWELIEPTIRKEGSIIFIIFNPRLKTDFAWKHFVVNTPPDTIVRKINYDENPFLSDTMLKVIENKKGSPEFAHIYLGEILDNDDNSIIKRSHLLAAVDAHKKLCLDILGSNTLGFDVADDGGDGCALVQSFGNCLVWADEWQAKEDELLKSCTRSWQEARNRNASIVYDAIGIGAFTGSRLDNINKYSNLNNNFVQYKKYFSGGAVLHPDKCYLDTKIKNKHFFANRKAQSWWAFSDRVRNTYNAVTNGEKFELDEMIFIDGSIPHLNKLIDELSTPTKDFDNNGRVKVESKKDLKKRGVDSPNLADAAIMSLDKTQSNSGANLGIKHFWKK